VTHETDNQIVTRYQQGQSLRSIARDLGLNRHRVSATVRDHLKRREQEGANSPLPAPPQVRGSQLDAFVPQIQQLLARYPHMTATRIHEELRRCGYQGGYTILRERVRQLRADVRRKPVIRFETGPGVQAQMDWAVYELDFAQEGRRRVHLFSYLLSYSRRQYLCFTERQDFEASVQQHIRAFAHLQGLATTCLYDNMKVVVTRWEDEQPIYNTRFLAFATHYGFRPWACRRRHPQTKGKVERPFFYVETNLLNGRTFRSLEHLNEVTRWWLANVADVRVHRTTQKRPVDAHAVEQPYLLPLPAQHYDTAQVVYRVVDAEGCISYGHQQYSVPWRLIGQLVPVCIRETELLVYNGRIEQVARHLLVQGRTGVPQIDPAHRPPDDEREQLVLLRQRFAEVGEVGSRFLEGLLRKQRYGKHQARRVLVLLSGYHRADVVAALERAVRYHAYAHSSLERILNQQATPKAFWQSLSDHQQETLRGLTEADSIDARSSAEYQYLLFPENDSDDPQQKDGREDPPPADPPASGDPEHPPDD
jgi:transposase